MIRKSLFCLVIAGSVTVLLTGGGFLAYFTPAGQSLPATGEAAALDSENESKLVVCVGYADVEGGITSLHPSQPGRVAEIPVKENDTVPAGAVLLRLEDKAARYRVAETKAELDSALALLAKAEKGPQQHRVRIAEQQLALRSAHNRVAVARHTLLARQERQKGEAIGRYRADPVTAQEVASASSRVKELEDAEKLEEEKLRALELRDPAIDVNHARAEVATMRARVLQAEQILEEHVLRAPGAGTVLRIFVSPGELLSAQSKKMAIQLCPDKPRIIRVEVEQTFAGRVKVGLPALVEDDARSGNTWRGHVMHMADWYTQRRLINEEQLQLKDVRTLECLIELDSSQTPLRIGQRARVTITEGVSEDKAVASKEASRLVTHRGQRR